MKKFLLALMCTGLLASCAFGDLIKYSEEINSGTDSNFDEYPGMNVNDNALTGTPFTLPAGITMEAITGQQNQEDEENQNEMAITDDMYGSGLFIIVTLKIKNASDKAQTVTLPAGLLMQSSNGNYQNGILVKDVDIRVKAEASREVTVRFYCLNSSLHGSDVDATYSPFAYVTNVTAFQPLFNVCEEKKINVEEYASIGILKYYTACGIVQEIVWAITKGKTFKEKDIRKYLKHVKDI